MKYFFFNPKKITIKKRCAFKKLIKENEYCTMFFGINSMGCIHQENMLGIDIKFWNNGEVDERLTDKEDIMQDFWVYNPEQPNLP